jgi:hypothetical protein
MGAQVAGSRFEPEVDRAGLRRFLVHAAKPALAWLLVIGGGTVLLLGYLGVSREVLVARQLPYLVSGGLAGVSMVFLGGLLLGLKDVRELNTRLARVERIASDLHAVLLAARPAAGVATIDPFAPATLVHLPGGDAVHRPGCRIVAGKAAEAVDAAQARTLAPCKLCDPVTAGG